MRQRKIFYVLDYTVMSDGKIPHFKIQEFVRACAQ